MFWLSMALLKERYLWANHANFMAKQLRMAIMKRSKLCNDFLKRRNDASQSACKKQSSLRVNILRKVKKAVFLGVRSKAYN